GLVRGLLCLGQLHALDETDRSGDLVQQFAVIATRWDQLQAVDHGSERASRHLGRHRRQGAQDEGTGGSHPVKPATGVKTRIFHQRGPVEENVSWSMLEPERPCMQPSFWPAVMS